MKRHTVTLVLTAGLAAWIELFFTIEWTYPYCLIQDDGPAYAVFGMPFPYHTYSGVSSMEDVMLPYIYLLNVLLLSLLLFPAIQWMFSRVVPKQSLAQLIAGSVGVLLLASMLFFQLFLIHSGFRRPIVSSLIYGSSYWDLRPVGYGMHPPSGGGPCSPSLYWFPTKLTLGAGT